MIVTEDEASALNEAEARKRFWRHYRVAEFTSQDEVNKVVWEYMDDEQFRPLLREIVFTKEAKQGPLGVALLTRPVLDLELVEELLNTNFPPKSNAGYGLTHSLAKLLSKHPDFDEVLFVKSLKSLAALDRDLPYIHTEWLSRQQQLPLSWILSAYCEMDTSSLERGILVSFIEEITFSNLQTLLENLAYPYYEELPQAWVTKMMQSLKGQALLL